mmetsp:Transcript_12403/g.34798  ORF Transcript_12403/g.34798 Transcript_12403/m.34798 type:complete len:249 (-) Transcript_12403:1844-2590(-)
MRHREQSPTGPIPKASSTRTLPVELELAERNASPATVSRWAGKLGHPPDRRPPSTPKSLARPRWGEANGFGLAQLSSAWALARVAAAIAALTGDDAVRVGGWGWTSKPLTRRVAGELELTVDACLLRTVSREGRGPPWMALRRGSGKSSTVVVRRLTLFILQPRPSWLLLMLPLLLLMLILGMMDDRLRVVRRPMLTWVRRFPTARGSSWLRQASWTRSTMVNGSLKSRSSHSIFLLAALNPLTKASA